MRNILFLFFLLFTTVTVAQKKTLDHTIFNSWKKIERSMISNNGNFVAYEINPHQGDGYLYVYNKLTQRTDSFPRGREAQFSYSNEYVAFKIAPGFDTLRKCELDKIDKKKWPKDSLGIYIFEKDTLIKVAKLKSFKLAEEGSLITYLFDDNVLEAKKEITKKKKHICKKKKSEEPKEYKSDGNILTFFSPHTLQKTQLKDVTDYSLSKSGEMIAVVTHKKEKVDSFALALYNSDMSVYHQFAATSGYRQLSFSKDADRFAYLQSADTAKTKQFQLQLFTISSKNNFTIADTSSTVLPEGKAISENYLPMFTDNGKYLFFGIADRVKQEPKDSLLETEKAKLDIWHYQDDRLQTQQLKELKSDQKKSDLYLYSLEDGKILGVTNDTLTASVAKNLQGDYLLIESAEAYALSNQWDVPDRADHYRMSLIDGAIETLKKEVRLNGLLSPTGNYYTFFDEKKNQFFLIDPATKEEKCITCSVKNINWLSDVNGMPMIASPYGVIGYSAQEKEILIQSEYDIWSYSIASQALSCLTNNEGEQRKIRLTPTKWFRDSVYFTPTSMYVEGFNEKTKGSHIFHLTDHGDHTDLIEKYYSDHKIISVVRAKHTDQVFFRKTSVKDFPEIRLTDTQFSSETILSSTNPQQVEYNWTTVELTSWKSYDGIELEGLVYKPENFDPNKKYPMLVYYYELYSDDLHNHYVPKPSASIIHPTEYASAGYIVFIPDVRYKSGHPAKGAYDCIMSGTDHVLKLVPNIDSKRMGLQGQSWGGYQTAQLITMTNRYAAAMAGAPVSNMFSAYGGIRWGSGVNRQFQYEKTQSRIGKTIWEAPELYTENSPLFHLPNVKTPLLIMHNDEDGAVPWYQSIELFTGMRRLGKPCWLLNYNGDDHNLMKNANRIDLSIRMKQFFDHYLMDQPAPLWLSEGIPAIDKGKISGY